MLEKLRAKLYVRRGIRLLNKHANGWREKVDVESLQISSGFRCVLGHVYGSYGDGCNALGLKTEEKAAKFGFDSVRGTKCSARYDSLQAEWERQLTKV